MATEASFTIGKVVKLLQSDYPDLSVSKVRFLEAEGLLKPIRTKSGYRMFTEQDIARLRAILKLQEDNFYPLAVIKDKLKAFDNGEDVAELADQRVTSGERSFMETNHSLEEIAEKAEVPLAFVRELVDGGFLEPVRDSMGKLEVPGYDLLLVKAAYELNAYGLDARYLKMHIQRVNRDVPYYKQALGIAAKRSAGDGSFDLDEALEKLISLNNVVSSTLIRDAIKRG